MLAQARSRNYYHRTFQIYITQGKKLALQPINPPSRTRFFMITLRENHLL